MWTQRFSGLIEGQGVRIGAWKVVVAQISDTKKTVDLRVEAIESPVLVRIEEHDHVIRPDKTR